MRNATLFLVSLGVVAGTAMPGYAAQATFGNSVSFMGSTVGQPTFNRPELGFPPPGLSVTETAVPYVSQAFDVSSTTSYQFSVTPITIPQGVSGTYVFLYQGNFDPLQPQQGLMIGATPTDPFGFIPMFTLPILFGNVRRYSLVVTGQTSSNVGIFSASISQQNSLIALGPSSQIDPAVPFQFSPLLGLLLYGGGWWLQRWWQKRKT